MPCSFSKTPTIFLLIALIVSFACSRNSPEVTTLTGSEWTLVELDGQPASLGAGEKPATLALTDTNSRASGFAGCNRFSSTYQVNGSALTFSPVLITKMACQAGMDLEQNLVRSLEATRKFRQTARGLELQDENDRVLARFEKR
jgi:heat shock protein HslJ